MFGLLNNSAGDYPGTFPSVCEPVGVVNSVPSDRAAATIWFGGRHDLVSAPLPVLFRSVSQSPSYELPGVGEPVLCLFLGNGIEDGFVLGAYYNADFPPPESGAVIYHRFANGSEVRYHTDTGKIDIIGDVNVTGTLTASKDVQAAGVSLKGHKHISHGNGQPTSGPA